MDRALAIGNRTILTRFSSGFGFYIETISPTIRPALAYDEEEEEEYTLFIEYSGTSIKLPFFVIEFGKFRVVEEGELNLINILPGIFEEEEANDDDDTSTMR